MEQFSNFNIKEHTTFGINSIVNNFLIFNEISELGLYLKQENINNSKHLIIGGGSNLLFVNDYNGTVIKPNFKGIELLEESEKYVYLKVGAAEIWDDFVAYCVTNNYWGIENLSLIPGTIGASPVQNIGAYGVEAKDVVFDVRTICKENGESKIFPYNKCEFAYRDSIFKKEDKWIITEVVFRLEKQGEPRLSYGGLEQVFKNKRSIKLSEIREAIIKIRESKLPDPKVIGNAGSFFKNPVVDIVVNNNLMQDYPQMPFYLVDIDKSKLAAGWLIDQAGWKGEREGDAGVHEKQALVIVNYGKASGKEIFDLSEKIIASVKEQFNVELEREVIVID